jgi:hypothetical protein
MTEAKSTSPQLKTDPKAVDRAVATTYPLSPLHEIVLNLSGEEYVEDVPIIKAWARMFDKGHCFGPTMADAFEYSGVEYQYFAFGYASRILHVSNVNLTSSFFDGHGFVGEESGL